MSSPRPTLSLRAVADQMFSRAAGAPLVAGNAVRVLRDAAENYPAWERAIAAATSTDPHRDVHRPSRRTGRRFVDLLAAQGARGRDGARRLRLVRLRHGAAPRAFPAARRRRRRSARVQPAAVRAALGWIRRNHRKLIAVDGRVAFVSGLCIGAELGGHPGRRSASRGATPASRSRARGGPRRAGVRRELAHVSGGRSTTHRCPIRIGVAPAGDVSAAPDSDRAVHRATCCASTCSSAALARRTLWITDAYFIGTGPYLEALRRAAQRRRRRPAAAAAGQRRRLDRAGVAVALPPAARSRRPRLRVERHDDAREDRGRRLPLARIGSTNLNLNSWMGNWELDVAIEDEAIARDDGRALPRGPRALRPRSCSTGRDACRPSGSPAIGRAGGRRGGWCARSPASATVSAPPSPATVSSNRWSRAAAHARSCC